MGLGGFKPTHFKKSTHVIIANPTTFCGVWGVRVEGEARAVSNCVEQTVTSNMPCYII